MQEKFTRVLIYLQEYIGRSEFADELSRAKKGYFEQIGMPREGEPFLEMRLASFIEWFTFDRKIDGVNITPVSALLRGNAESISERDRELLASFENSIHSLFKVKKNRGENVVLKDLFSGRKYKQVQNLPPSLDRGDVVETRLVPVDGKFHLTDAYCYHPPKAHKFVVHELKKARKNGDDLEGLLRQFMAMSTKWERYPRMKLSEIYKWKK